jgi:hypothetical protein
VRAIRLMGAKSRSGSYETFTAEGSIASGMTLPTTMV